MRTFTFSAALLAPTCILLFHFYGFYPELLHTAFGDPDYGYLMNSLLLLEGKAPIHIDHPGTTVQLLGAAVIRIIYFFQNTSYDLVDAVLAGPYLFLRSISLLLVTILAASVFAYGVVLAHKGYSWWVVLAAQWSPMLLPSSWDYLVHVSPEILLMAAGMWVATILLARETREQMNGTFTALLGVAIGFGIASKFNFLPIIILLLYTKNLRSFLAGAAATFSTFLFLTFPIWGAYPRIFRWLFGIYSQPGNNGMGGPAFLSGRDLLAANFWYLWETSRPFFLLLLIFPLAAAANFFAKNRRENFFRLALAGLASLILLALVLKQVGGRYLLPSVAVWAWIIPLALSFKVPKFLGPASAGLVLLLLGFSVSDGFAFWQRVTTSHPRNSWVVWELREKIKEFPDCGIIYSPPAPVEAFPLYGGDISVNGIYTKRLQKLYPGTIFYDIYPGQFRSFLELLPLEEVKFRMKEKKCLLLLGTNQILEKNQSLLVGAQSFLREEVKHPFDLEPILERIPVSLYRIKRFHNSSNPKKDPLRGAP